MDVAAEGHSGGHRFGRGSGQQLEVTVHGGPEWRRDLRAGLLACIALIGLPILVAEWLIGRRGQKNPVSTMADVAHANGHSRQWGLVGALGVLGAFLILSFYSVIGGWALSYTLSAAKGSFLGYDQQRKVRRSRAFWAMRRRCCGTRF